MQDAAGGGRQLARVAVAVCGVVFAAGCPGAAPSGASFAPPPTSISLQPAAATVPLNGTLVLTASFVPAGADTRVTWQVQESGGGTVSSSGVYQAPAAGGVFHLVATSVAAPDVSGVALLTVPAPVAIAIAAQGAVACVATQLNATVTGSATRTATWTVPDTSCGTITPAGVFTSVRGTGTCAVAACSTVSASACATSNVTVSAERVLGVAVTPAAASLSAGGTEAFVAQVTTSCGSFAAGK